MNRFNKALGVSALLSLFGAQAGAQVVQTSFNPGEGFSNVATNSAVVNPVLGAGWATGSALTLVDVATDQFLVLDGGESVSFTMSGLTMGQMYDLRIGFDMVGYRSPLGTTGQGLLRITSAGLPQRTVDETFGALGTPGCNPSGVNASNCQGLYAAGLAAVPRGSVGYMPFTAASTSLTLTFTALVNSGANAESVMALDNVRVAVTAVPEPETWALMLAGVLAVGSLLRRRPA